MFLQKDCKNETAQKFRQKHSDEIYYHQSLHMEQEALKSSQKETVKLLTICESTDNCPWSISDWPATVFTYNKVTVTGDKSPLCFINFWAPNVIGCTAKDT